jgi:hypothetical protein
LGFFDKLNLTPHVEAWHNFQKYGPNYQEVIRNQAAELQHKEKERARELEDWEYQDTLRREHAEDRPLHKDILTDRATVADNQRVRSDRNFLEETTTDRSYGEAWDKANKSANNSFDKSSSSHVVDPASDIQPDKPSSYGRQRRAEDTGVKQFQQNRATTATANVNAMNAEFLGSPEGQEAIEDERAAAAEDKKIARSIRKIQHESLLDSGQGSPASRKKRLDAALKGFRKSVSQGDAFVDKFVDQLLNQQMVELGEMFNAGLDTQTGDVQIPGDPAQAEQFKIRKNEILQQREQLVKQVYMNNAASTLPGDVKNIIMSGQPADEYQTAIIYEWFRDLNEHGITQGFLKASPSEASDLAQRVLEMINEGMINFDAWGLGKDIGSQ